MTASKKKNLGRGLSALLGDSGERFRDPDKVGAPKTLSINMLRPGKYQPRQSMNPEQIDELAQSIRDKGILQPLLIRRDPSDDLYFEIIAGERRWRAAQVAGLREVPVVIREFTDLEALEIGLIENLQREDLSALEEADGYKRLLDEFGHTQEVLANSVGKSRSHVTNIMRLLGLPASIKVMLEDGALSAGHARALLKASNAEELAKIVVKQGLNVRQIEELVRKSANLPSKPVKLKAKDSNTVALEQELQNNLGLNVSIKYDGKKGSITINYSDLDQLDDVIKRLKTSSLVDVS